MGTEKTSKLNTLLSMQPPGTVLLSSWLKERGYSFELQKRYKKSLWFETIGSGAMIRHGDQVDYLGAVYALQNQAGASIHPAAKTALALQGKAHYLEFATKKVYLFGSQQDHFPLWLKNYDWDMDVECLNTSFLPAGLGLTEIDHKTFSVNVSGPARAMMECLYLAPKLQPIEEAFELMEGLNNLRPALVQSLLENCTSIKVKRLFIYLAEKAEHEWLNYLDMGKIDLGAGKRSFERGGSYVAKHKITVPKSLKGFYG